MQCKSSGLIIVKEGRSGGSKKGSDSGLHGPSRSSRVKEFKGDKSIGLGFIMTSGSCIEEGQGVKATWK